MRRLRLAIVLFWLYCALFLWGWLRETIPGWPGMIVCAACIASALIRVVSKKNHPMLKLVERAMAVFVLFQTLSYCFVSRFTVDGVSMEPTLPPGKTVWVEKISLGLILPPVLPGIQSRGYHRFFGHLPERGEIIVIRFPGLDDGPDALLVKRVAALPGDSYDFSQKKISINGMVLSSISEISHAPERLQPPVYRMSDEIESLGSIAVWAAANGIPAHGVVPANSLLVLGDHHRESRDSRSFGFVPVSFVMGCIMNNPSTVMRSGSTQ